MSYREADEAGEFYDDLDPNEFRPQKYSEEPPMLHSNFPPALPVASGLLPDTIIVTVRDNIAVFFRHVGNDELELTFIPQAVVHATMRYIISQGHEQRIMDKDGWVSCFIICPDCGRVYLVPDETETHIFVHAKSTFLRLMKRHGIS